MMNLGALPQSLLAQAEASRFREVEVFKEQNKEVIDALGSQLGDGLKRAIGEFFKELDKWMTAQTAGGNATTPFIPPPPGTPMLNFLPSPYEWSLRRDEPVGQVLTSERETPIARRIRSGGIIIVNPPPFP